MRLHILDGKKNDLGFFFFFLQLPILHSHWFNFEYWLMIPWLQIPKESTANPHNGFKWQNMQIHPTKKPILNTRLTYLVFNCLKVIICFIKSFFSFMNLGEMCYFDIWQEIFLTNSKTKRFESMQYPNAIHWMFFAFKSFVENIYHKTFHITLSSKVPNMEI